ncbi:MAG TPA: sn-glycerol-3-phosphate ABC transporter ATP-binding protein UgpC [Candidatus Pelethenecus sp.]|nr:sn-glycerol-3-phosphate ABC transporter ATP-binding protein UgpC [Candidatus Pelethenecus sp.]
MATDVILKDVNKVYPNGFHAVYDFNIEIEKGEFIVMAGPSGCGKSTTLRMIAGLEEISSGDLIINGKRVNDVAPKDRDIAMVFQNYALYAHMSVYHNMAFSLTIRKVDPAEIHKRVMQAAEILGLVPYLNRKPKELSGGQRQRVACGRAIVRDPVVFLLDEPLSNLDAKLRGTMRKELMNLHDRLNATFIYVTHDQIEALTLASRIVVMNEGYVQQIATPKEMFDNPENLFVAGFIGTPPMNFANGKISEDGKYFEHISGNKLKLTQHQTEILKTYRGKQVVMASRSEYIGIDEASLTSNPESTFEIEVDYTEYLGAYTLIYGLYGGENVIAKVYTREPIAKMDKVKACFDMEKIHFFDIETTKRIR